MHDIYYLYIGLSGEHRCPLGYLLIFVLKMGMCLQGLMKFHQCIFKILRKLSIQKLLRITKENNSNSIGPYSMVLNFLSLVFFLKIGMCLQGLMKSHQ